MGITTVMEGTFLGDRKVIWNYVDLEFQGRQVDRYYRREKDEG